MGLHQEDESAPSSVQGLRAEVDRSDERMQTLVKVAIGFVAGAGLCLGATGLIYLTIWVAETISPLAGITLVFGIAGAIAAWVVG